MKDNRASQPVHAGVGIPSVILIIVVTCLTSFGVLSLSSARSCYKLTQQNAAYVCAYYDAAAQANEYIAKTAAQGIDGSYAQMFDITDQLKLDLRFMLDEHGRVGVTRFSVLSSGADEPDNYE